MPNYDVHIYAIARMKVADVEADSSQAAAQRAERSANLHQLIAAGQAEYTEDVEGFLVDPLDESGRRIEGRSVFLDVKKGEASWDPGAPTT